MKQSILNQRHGIQLSYDLPHTVHATQIYPRQASNGSTVVIYGHETGVRVIWYGGNKIANAGPKLQNGNHGKDESMAIDLNEDETGQPHILSGHFEHQTEGTASIESYYDIIRHVDIPLATAVLQLTVPNVQTQDEEDLPAPFRDNMLVAVGCIDHTIRVLSIPRDPPASDISQLDIQSIKLHAPGFHQDLVTAIAITLLEDDEDTAEHMDESQPDTNTNWSILVASTSCTGSGLMLIHQIPIMDGKLSEDAADLNPIRRVHMRAPLMAAKLSFNTAPPHDSRHCTLLVTIPDPSCAKLYDPFPQTLPNRNRRGSAATTDSASSTRSIRPAGAGQGKVLITLLPEFNTAPSEGKEPLRKKILDSAWILGGRAIIVLLEDGEWGIWDLEAAGPTSSASNRNLIKGQSNVAGIVGGAISRFALRGRISDATVVTKKSQNQNDPTGLVPATPHTRKTRAEGLFRGTSSTTPESVQRTQLSSVVVAPSTSKKNDESILMNYGSHRIFISSLVAFWKANATSAIVTNNSHIISLPTIRSAGQRIKLIGLLPRLESEKTDTLFGDRTPPNILLATDNRLILYLQSFSMSLKSYEPVKQQQLPVSSFNQPPQPSRDVETIDQILDNMDTAIAQPRNTGNRSQTRSKPNFGNSVMIGDDVEMEDNSPAPVSRSKLTVEPSQGSARRLFS